MKSLGNFLKSRGYNGSVSFLTTTPDQYIYFLKDETCFNFLKENPSITSNHIKNEIYYKYFIDMKKRKKKTGFENLSQIDQYYRNKYEKLYGKTNSDRFLFNVMLDNISELDQCDDLYSYCTYKKKNNNVNNFKEACMDAAKYHHKQSNNLNKTIYLGMSGGCDSEVAAESLLLQGVDFIPFIVNYKGKNSEDISYAKEWCHKNGIDYVEYILDVEDFLKNESHVYAKETKVPSPHMLVYQRIIDIIGSNYNGYVLFGGEIRACFDESEDVMLTSYAFKPDDFSDKDPD